MAKRIAACLLAALLALSCAACGGEKEASTAGAKTLTGTLDEVKDFMFTVTDEAGDSYVLGFEGEAPEGLSDLQVGDEVTVTYTGELSVVDAFEGENPLGSARRIKNARGAVVPP